MTPKTHQNVKARLRLASVVVAATSLALAGCNGATTSIGVPAASPWNQIQTVVASPYDDLTVVTVGSNISAGFFGAQPGAVCTSDQGGFFAICDGPGCTPPGPLAECLADAPGGATNVGFSGDLPILYGLGVALDRPSFTAGGVQLVSTTAGTVGAIAIEIGSSTLDIGAAFSDGLIPGPAFDSQYEAFDDFTIIGLGPAWEDFGPGYVCTDGTTTSCDPSVAIDGVMAICDSGDNLLFRTNAISAPVSLTCGTVTVNLNVNPPFDTVGQCVSTLKAQHCSGLKGKAKAACNHAQIGVCHAAFNVPSSHNG
jgi:hypothetical protein